MIRTTYQSLQLLKRSCTAHRHENVDSGRKRIGTLSWETYRPDFRCYCPCDEARKAQDVSAKVVVASV
jgi:hypothetical protein